MRIHTGDTVLVISGKDKGKTGTVLRVLGDRVVVGDVNMRTRHVRKTAQGPGQRIRYEASIAAANIMAIDPKSKKPTRIGIRIDEKGRRVRIAKVSGEVIVAGKVAAKKGLKAAPAKKKTKDAEKQAQAEQEQGKETAAPQAEKVAAPPRKPFWKSLGFGAEAVKEEEDHKARPADHSIPAETRTPESFSHSRGS